MQAEFVKHLRTEANRRSIYILGVFIASAFLFLVALLKGIENGDDDEKINLLRWLSIDITVSTFCFVCVICFTRCISIKFSEILGLSLMLPTAILSMIAYTTSDVITADDLSSRRIIIEVVAVVYLIVANFLTTEYLPHLAAR